MQQNRHYLSAYSFLNSKVCSIINQVNAFHHKAIWNVIKITRLEKIQFKHNFEKLVVHNV